MTTIKRRIRLIYSTAICSGTLLLALGILCAAVLAGEDGSAAAQGWLWAGEVDAAAGAALLAIGIALRLWANARRNRRRARRTRGRDA